VIYELHPADDDVSEVDRAFVAGVLKGSTSERLAILRLLSRLQREGMVSYRDCSMLKQAIQAGEHQLEP
jgi:hypothetical protein